MKCNNCGQILNSNDIFCPNCGTKIVNNNGQFESSDNVRQTNQYNSYQPNNNQNNYQTVHNQSNNYQMNNNQQFNNTMQNNNQNIYQNNYIPPIKKQKKKPYWLLPVASFLMYFILVIVRVIIGLVSGVEEPTAMLSFIDTILKIFQTVFLLGTLPCVVIAIVLYNTKTPAEEQNYSVQMNQVLNNNISLPDKLLAVYIGNNYHKIMNNKFSVPAFFLSWIYMLYRKMYIPTLIGMACMTIFNILSISTYVAFALCITLGFVFNHWYVKDSRKKVAAIMQNNPNAPQEYLINLCQKKGGTNLGYAILIYIGFIIVQLIALAIWGAILN